MYLVYFYVDVMYVCCNKLTYNLEHLATNLTKCSAFLSVVLAGGCHNRDQQPPTECGCRHLSLHITLSPPLLRARSVEMRVSRVSAVLLLSLAALTSAQGEAREGRPKPWLREKMERQKVVTIIIIMCSVSPVSVFRTCSGSAPRRTRPARPPAPPWTRPAWRSFQGRPGTPARCSTVHTVQYSTIAIYPLSSHQEDGARFCFCGKKGAAETTNWKFICGT